MSALPSLEGVQRGTFVRGRQEDAHEALRALLEGMQRACVREERAARGVSEWVVSGADLIKERTSVPRQVFGGEVRSRVHCQVCGANSDTFQDEMFALANGHPTTLLVICTEAQKRGLLKLSRAALRRLEKTRKYRTEVVRLRQQLAGPPRVHPEAEIAAIEKLYSQGLAEMARNRLERAERDWPGRPEWVTWRSKLDAEE